MIEEMQGGREGGREGWRERSMMIGREAGRQGGREVVERDWKESERDECTVCIVQGTVWEEGWNDGRRTGTGTQRRPRKNQLHTPR